MPKDIGYPPGSQKTMMAKKGGMMYEKGTPQMRSENLGETVMSIETYPDLAGLEVGAAVSGNWEGTIEKVEGDNVTIRYTGMELETENEADRAMDQMIGRKPKMTTPEEEE